jgi:hypothetical protein
MIAPDRWLPFAFSSADGKKIMAPVPDGGSDRAIVSAVGACIIRFFTGPENHGVIERRQHGELTEKPEIFQGHRQRPIVAGSSCIRPVGWPVVAAATDARDAFFSDRRGASREDPVRPASPDEPRVPCSIHLR